MSRFIVPLGFILAAGIAIGIYVLLPTIGPVGEQMFKGGPLVAALILLIILQTAFIIERIWSLKKAQGRGPLPDFLIGVRKRLHTGDVAGAIEMCSQQRGSAANVIRAGLRALTREEMSAGYREFQEIMAGLPKDPLTPDIEQDIVKAVCKSRAAEKPKARK